MDTLFKLENSWYNNQLDQRKSPEYETPYRMLIWTTTRENRSSGFRPSPTQTGLWSHRSRPEALNFRFRKKRDCTVCAVKTKALISCAVTAQLISAFVFAYVKIRCSHIIFVEL